MLDRSGPTFWDPTGYYEKEMAMKLVFTGQMKFEQALWNGKIKSHVVDFTLWFASQPSNQENEDYFIETNSERVEYENYSEYPNSAFKNCMDKIVDSHKSYRKAVKTLKLLNR